MPEGKYGSASYQKKIGGQTQTRIWNRFSAKGKLKITMNTFS